MPNLWTLGHLKALHKLGRHVHIAVRPQCRLRHLGIPQTRHIQPMQLQLQLGPIHAIIAGRRHTAASRSIDATDAHHRAAMAVQLQQIGRAGLAVQLVDVLGDQATQVAGTLEARQRLMCGVRLERTKTGSCNNDE